MKLVGLTRRILWSFFGIFILFFLGGLIKTTYWSYNSRIIWTHRSLSVARLEIERFKSIQGKYPDSLVEINRYAEQNPGVGFRGIPFKEFFSDLKGNSKESSILTGQGGWYYDPNTGKVQVNLTKPVKHYMWFYVGEERDEIPAKW